MPELVDHFKLDVQHDGEDISILVPDRRNRGARLEERWSRQKSIGQGSFGMVWVYSNFEGSLRAVKIVRKTMGNHESFGTRCVQELHAMARLTKYPDHFAEFFGWNEEPDSLFLWMEYFPHGDLQHCVRGPLAESQARQIASQVLEALEIVHAQGFTHRDLNPTNIFVVEKSPNWWVKLGDFGVTKHIDEDITMLKTIVGTPVFMAPEILDEDNSAGYTDAVDMWAFGCVLYILLCFNRPFPNTKAVNRYARGQAQLNLQPLHDQNVSMESIELVQQLIDVEAARRPSARTALSCAWSRAATEEANVDDIPPTPTLVSTMSTQASSLSSYNSTSSQMTFKRKPVPTLPEQISTISSSPSLASQTPYMAESESFQEQSLFSKVVSASSTASRTPSTVDPQNSSIVDRYSATDHTRARKPASPVLPAPEQKIPQRSYSSNAPMATPVSKHIRRHLSEQEKRDTMQRLAAERQIFNSQTFNPTNMLLSSAMEGDEDAVLLSIEMGANLRAVDSANRSPLWLAVNEGHDDIAEVLIAVEVERQKSLRSTLSWTHGWSTEDAKDGNQALHIAAMKGSERLTRRLLGAGADIEAKNSAGFTPLYVAIDYDHVNVVRDLLNNKAVCTWWTRDGTALHLAARVGSVEICRQVLQAGKIDIDACRTHVGTPLIVALRCQEKEVVQYLIGRGASVKVHQLYRFSPLEVAIDTGRPDIVSIILERNSDWRQPTTVGKNILHLAAHAQKKDLVKMFVDLGVDPTTRTSERLKSVTPWRVACDGIYPYETIDRHKHPDHEEIKKLLADAATKWIEKSGKASWKFPHSSELGIKYKV